LTDATCNTKMNSYKI